MVADLLEVSVTVDGVGKFICTQPRSHVGLFFHGNEVIFAIVQKISMDSG